MKAKIINKNSDYYLKTISIKKLDHRYIAGILPDGNKIKIPFEDAEIILDSKWEENIIKHKEILKISLPASVSIRFYGALNIALNEYYKDEIINITIINDVNEKARKNYWYKRIDILINNEKIAAVSAWGRDYSEMFDINIEEVDINSFIMECRSGISRLKELVQKSLEKINQYERIIQFAGISINGNINYKALEGR